MIVRFELLSVNTTYSCETAPDTNRCYIYTLLVVYRVANFLKPLKINKPKVRIWMCHFWTGLL